MCARLPQKNSAPNEHDMRISKLRHMLLSALRRRGLSQGEEPNRRGVRGDRTCSTKTSCHLLGSSDLLYIWQPPHLAHDLGTVRKEERCGRLMLHGSPGRSGGEPTCVDLFLVNHGRRVPAIISWVKHGILALPPLLRREQASQAAKEGPSNPGDRGQTECPKFPFY